MFRSPNQKNVCMISFPADTNGDTSKGGCTKSKSSLDLNDSRVQERYYDPDSEKGFDWVASVKYDWDTEDIFHSRFPVPPRPHGPLAKVFHSKQDDNLDMSTETSVDMIPIPVPTARPIF